MVSGAGQRPIAVALHEGQTPDRFHFQRIVLVASTTATCIFRRVAYSLPIRQVTRSMLLTEGTFGWSEPCQTVRKVAVFCALTVQRTWCFAPTRDAMSRCDRGHHFLLDRCVLGSSYLVAARLASRIGLVNTMVFTHLPSNILLILVPFMPNLPLVIVPLLARYALSHMDVPPRNSYVMAVVPPAERPAAASITAVPRTLPSAITPFASGYLLGLSPFGWPLVLSETIKGVSDLLLLTLFAKVPPPQEAEVRG